MPINGREQKKGGQGDLFCEEIKGDRLDIFFAIGQIQLVSVPIRVHKSACKPVRRRLSDRDSSRIVRNQSGQARIIF
jgi:hypothetical protein